MPSAPDAAPPPVQRLEQALRDRILRAVWPPGTQLPSERELAGEFGASVSTIKRALGFLRRDGLLVGRQGKGRFVAGRPARHPTRTIAVVAANRNEIDHPSLMRQIAGIRETLHEAGFNLNLMAVRERRAIDSHFADLFTLTPIIDVAAADAAIVLGMPDGHTEPIYALARHFPVCSTTHFLHGRGLGCVLGDGAGGAFRIALHLADLGHRRIAFVAPDDRNIAAVRQRDGIRLAALARPETRFHVHLTDEYLVEEGERAVAELLALPEPPTAIACGSGELLLGVWRGLAARRKRVPRDISLTGWGDSNETAEIPLTMTRFCLDPRRVGARAARLVLRLVEDPSLRPPAEILAGELLIGDSTRPPPGGAGKKISGRDTGSVTGCRADA